VQKFGFEIIDEAYGYNQTRFSGSMFLEKDWFEVEIEIYHFNETKYMWME